MTLSRSIKQRRFCRWRKICKAMTVFSTVCVCVFFLFLQNCMRMNLWTKFIIIDKTKHLNFPSHIKFHEIYCCLCTPIEQLKEIRYFGDYVDVKVKWNFHVNYVKSRLTNYVRLFYVYKLVTTIYKIMRTIHIGFWLIQK